MELETLLYAALALGFALIAVPFASRRRVARGNDTGGVHLHDHVRRRRAEQLLEMQKETLENVAIGEPLPEILQRLAQEVSRQTGGTNVAFMLAEDDGTLALTASTSLPAGMADELGVIRFSGSDDLTATDDPLLKPFQRVAAAHGLTTCCASPVLGRAGTLLGVLVGFARRPLEDHEVGQRVLQTSANVAAVAIESDRARSALQRNEERFRSIIEHVSDVLTILDETGAIRYSSRSAEALTGYPLGSKIGSPVTDLVHPDDRMRVIQTIQELGKGPGRAATVETRLVRRDGSIRYVEAVATNLLDEPMIGGILITIRDITDRHAMEGSLRESNQMLRAIIEGSPFAIIAVDINARVQTWSRAAEQIFGWTSEEVMGELVPLLRESPEVRDTILHRIREGLTITGEIVERRRRDGSMVELMLSTAPLRDAAGELKGTVALFADVSQERRLEHQLRHSQKMEAVGRLAGGIAHDFNNLLTVIEGYAQFALEETASEDPRREDIAAILEAAGRAATLTSQLLAFSRKQVLQPRVLELNGVIRNAERLLGRVIGEHIRLRTNLDGEGCVRADPSQIEQVLMNLAINARDAMPRGGSLGVSTRSVHLDRSELREFPEIAPGEYIHVRVSDTGDGIDPKVQPHIFEPFFTTKAPGVGTGLGLSTVYGIVTQSGGAITLESVPGEGTTFHIYLPKVARQFADAPIALGESHQPGGSETILVTEDEGPLRRLIVRSLERLGYTILEAQTPDDALRLSATYDGMIDLLLTDVVMPGLGGRELADRVTAQRPDIHLLFISGYTSDDVVRRGIIDSSVAFLGKPFLPEELAKKVREVLDG